MYSISYLGSRFKKVEASGELKFKSKRQTFFWSSIFENSYARFTARDVFPHPPLFEKIQITFDKVWLTLFFISLIFLIDASRTLSMTGFKRKSLTPEFRVKVISSELISYDVATNRILLFLLWISLIFSKVSFLSVFFISKTTNQFAQNWYSKKKSLQNIREN